MTTLGNGYAFVHIISYWNTKVVVLTTQNSDLMYVKYLLILKTFIVIVCSWIFSQNLSNSGLPDFGKFNKITGMFNLNTNILFYKIIYFIKFVV